MTGSNFVGRKEHTELILPADRTGRGPSAVFSVEGIPGIGKTALARRLAELAEEQGRTVVRIDCGGIFLGSDTGGRTPPEEDAEFRHLRDLLRPTANDLPDSIEKQQLADHLQGHSRKDLDDSPDERPGFGSSRRSKVSAGPMNLDEYLEVVRDASERLAISLAGRCARLLVLIDDFHMVASRPLGGWLMDLVSGLKDADVVILHQELRDQAAAGLLSGVVALPLGNLDRADVTAYLSSRDGIGPNVRRIDDLVWGFTRGHPDALVLTADLIKENQSIQRSADMIGQISAVQGGREKQLEEVVRRIVQAIDEELRDALYILCVPRYFDRQLFQHLVADTDVKHAGDIVERLESYSFVEVHTPTHQYHSITGFVREIIIGHLDTDSTRQQAIHLKAAEYYEERMRAEWDEDDTSYTGWYRYEKPVFQSYQREWLYHLRSLTPANGLDGRLSFARIFFDVFWWWGSYVPYQFCEDLLTDWSATRSGDDPDDRTWGTLLTDVYQQYPRDWRDPGSVEVWDDILQNLLLIRRYGGLDGPRPADRKLRHLRAIIDIYLADAVRFADPADDEADERFDDAEELFQADNDQWNLGWLACYRADLAVMRGQAELALALVTDDAEAHRDLGDEELLANLNRVWSDAKWLLGDYGAALDAAGRAVAHAYRFELSGATPDEYTAAFQNEMTGRALSRLASLHADAEDTGQAALRAAIIRIHDLFAPYWRALRQDQMGADEIIQILADGRYDDAAAALFPACPAATDLNRPGTAYAKICNRFRDRTNSRLAQPPGAPLALPDDRPG